ncbi:MAG: FAD-binding oxidoreductase [Thermoplasmata archaeon]
MVYSDLSFAYKRLRDTLGEERVSTENLEKLVYSHDFAPLPKQAAIQFKLKPDIMTLPRSTQEVVRILKLGRELEFPVVPRGGGTSLHGGSVPNVGGILLSTNLMNRVEDVDENRLSITAQAGAIWKDVMDAVSDAGFSLPVAPIFYRSSTVGGFLSNGGVGIGSYKFGPASHWVRSLEVALPEGRTLDTGEKDFDIGSQNYNLTNLFLGAEGTLGVITEATLKVVPAPERVSISAYSFESIRAMVYALSQLARLPITPNHISFVDGSHLILQTALLKQLPDVPAMVLLAFEGDKKGVVAEGKVADDVLLSSGGRKEGDEVGKILWEDRYEPYSARRISGGLVVAEGLVPLSRLEEAVELTTRVVKRLKAEAAFHGFLVDRSSAYLAPYFLTNERFLRGQLGISFVERYHRILTDLDGHPLGLGMPATYNLQTMYGHITAYMRGVKQALDPESTVNRGKLLGTMGKNPPLIPADMIPLELPRGLMRRGLRVLGALRRLMPADRYVSKLRRKR